MKRAMRQSSLKTYLFCPRSYQLRFIEDTLPAFRNPKALFGSAIHELIRRMHAGEWEMDIADAYLQVFEDLEHGEEGKIPIRWKEEAKERAQFEELLSQIDDPQALQAAQQILLRCGAVSYCAYQVVQRHQAGQQILDTTPLADPTPLLGLLARQAKPIVTLLESVGAEIPPGLGGLQSER